VETPAPHRKGVLGNQSRHLVSFIGQRLMAQKDRFVARDLVGLILCEPEGAIGTIRPSEVHFSYEEAN
jgi:hypothetical protein